MTRTYVITGSASGIGAATAAILRDRGERVIGIDLRDTDIEADLSTPEGRADAAARAMELAESIDAVIACAGISAPIPKTISVNYFGVTELLTALLPALARSQAPRAAVVSSMASLQPNSPDMVEAALAGDEPKALEIAAALAAQGPQVGYLVYPSSKRALSRWVRRESITPAWAGAGIPLNAVAPGTVVTPMTAGLLSTPEGQAMVDAAVPMPLNGHQSPESIAYLLIWLTSVENTHLAGQVIYDDGGADVTLRGDDIWSWADSR
ncbi:MULTISPECIES: SDR family oxidoreductase [unclassified Microbacterium]|uniref:SDR family oxidoreductase n=1 Tax=unclassified Microbacterium TaxID=2609290 RepID=UPI00214ABD7E|nr:MULTISPECIES: SDR family oxidoreductase [unclassified Microbacterium]MCR2808105.1 SDR family oxidoreductase [Microbacterium sp. zg.B185]WIM19428.1 SDR family oxidoreductase [Microbacterium sp. zg-B185]